LQSISSRLWVAIALCIALLFWLGSVARISGNPAMLPDERIYKDQALFLEVSEVEFPNYLFNYLYGFAAECDSAAYTCSKLFNLGALVVLALLFGYAFGALLGINKIAIAGAVSILPIANYSAIFSPDLLYYLFSTLALFLAWFGATRHKPIFFALAGSAVALGSLTKPHALILLIPLIVYPLVQNFLNREQRRLPWWKLAGSLFISFLVTRASVGFILAGTAGLSPLGPGYTQVLERFLGFEYHWYPTSLLAGASQLLAAESQTPGIFATVSTLAVTFGLTFVALAAPPLLATRWSQSENSRSFEARSLASLTILTSLAFVSAIFIWAIIATAVGDDQTQRVLGRYFEFLVPFTLLSFAVSLSVFGDEQRRNRVRSGLGLGLMIVSLFALGQLVEPQLFDFALVYAISFSPIWSWTFLVLGLVAAFGLAVDFFKNSRKWLIVFGAILALLLGLAGHLSFLDLGRTQTLSADDSGIQASIELENIPGSEITLITADRPQSELMRFYIGKPDIQVIISDGGSFSRIDLSKVRPQSEWLVTTGFLILDEGFDFVKSYSGFEIYHLGEGLTHYFSENMTKSFIDSVDGEFGFAGFGITSEGPVKIALSEPVSGEQRFGLQFLATPGFTGQSLNWQACGVSGSLEIVNQVGANYQEFMVASEACREIVISRSAFDSGAFGLIFLEKLP